ncbi:Gfo/Idh/MocA family protein [Vibrio hangzhouensis]|uniref:Gfo/Idh/MocA family protein n=1 Tax=Vibrio hangzhouensis TaxID=462991 RepID=UPI001C93D05F|nr:Gfo/Idh/MocA family oxidoreductase [Vibrio hangzhouensis]MBY6198744.1 Gfo/Idh/MocA family oxidoreductase [Vibrio hangzhouensis]
MINLAIIGTNWISEKFARAALETERFVIRGVYSRGLEKARQFGGPLGATLFFDTLESLGNCESIDAVYIASPNSLHCEQAIQLMRAGKHVICEKPMASNLKEATSMFAVAQEQNVILMEAFKTAYLPNFIEAKKTLPDIGKLHKAHLTYCQYSSRYQKYLDGENPNTFNPEFSNGSIMDIGFYSVATAVELFGAPTDIQASAHLLESGVDAHGSVLLRYPDFDVTLSHSKVSNSYSTSEIQGEEASLLLPDFSECPGFDKQLRTGERIHCSVAQGENSMMYEAEAFAQMIANDRMDPHATQRSLEIARIITLVREQTGVSFPADNP